MRQILFRVPGLNLPVFGFGLMLCLALLASTQVAAWRARREKLDPELIYDLSLWVLIGGLVGARAFYVIQYWGVRVQSLLDVFRIWEGGIVFYGSVVGAASGFFLYRLLRPFPIGPVLDAIAPAVALGIALGRIGCFLNGCCFGDECNPHTFPWAVTFPKGSGPWFDQLRHAQIGEDALRSMPVHPTQLYAALDGLVLFLLLNAYYPLRRRDGEVMALLMVTYPVTRFLIERLRDDEGAVVAGLTISQTISLGLFAAGLATWAYLSRCPALRFADEVPEPARSASA